jgi:hypothetical protein
MSENKIQTEMMQIVQNCISDGQFEAARESLDIYRNTFGYDGFYNQCFVALTLQYDPPAVSVICLNTSDEQVECYIAEEEYTNLEIIRISEDKMSPETDFTSELFECIEQSKSKYICFLELNHSYSPVRISRMVSYMEICAHLDGYVCVRSVLDDKQTVLAHPDPYLKNMDKAELTGKDLVEISIDFGINLYGDLSTLMLRTDYVKALPEPNIGNENPMRNTAILYDLLIPAKVGYAYTPFVEVIAQPDRNDEEMLKSSFEKFSNKLLADGIIKSSPEEQPVHTPVKKEITFFYTDKGEYYNLEPIAREAERRGFKINFTENLWENAEIGVYCQHATMLEKKDSKFSAILLHDLSQGHDRWPSFWEVERWDEFDIGILPGKTWRDIWEQEGCFYYSNPRSGVFELGYPKCDTLYDEKLLARIKELKQQLNLKYDFSVLYAPSWENDAKEDDYVKALADLPVNLLIKQCHWNEEYEEVINNIKEMRELHEGKYENVYYIEPEESIMVALGICDMVISDESSVMAEATMFGKLSIAIIDWLVMDTEPHQLVSVPMDFVIKSKKEDMRANVEKVMNNPEQFADILEKGKNNFSNQGCVCRDIMDAIEYYAFGKEAENGEELPFMKRKLKQRYETFSLWN